MRSGGAYRSSALGLRDQAQDFATVNAAYEVPAVCKTPSVRFMCTAIPYAAAKQSAAYGKMKQSAGVPEVTQSRMTSAPTQILRKMMVL